MRNTDIDTIDVIEISSHLKMEQAGNTSLKCLPPHGLQNYFVNKPVAQLSMRLNFGIFHKVYRTISWSSWPLPIRRHTNPE